MRSQVSRSVAPSQTSGVAVELVPHAKVHMNEERQTRSRVESVRVDTSKTEYLDVLKISEVSRFLPESLRETCPATFHFPKAQYCIG